MIASTLRLSAAGIGGVAAVALLVQARPAVAADASPWDGAPQGAVRLVGASPPPGEAALRAGIQFKLGPGWKTYWRYPGDSGVPPRFDFSRSKNLKSVTVLWPAPRAFTDESGTSIGYKDQIILPLRVVAEDPARSVTLRLSLDYAICERLCVPASGHLELLLDRQRSAHDAGLAVAEARVPKRRALGERAGLAILAVRREGSWPKPRIVVDVSNPTPVELFAEGPAPDWALPVPEPNATSAEVQQFSFPLDGIPPGTKPQGNEITLTAVSAGEAIEVPVRLD